MARQRAFAVLAPALLALFLAGCGGNQAARQGGGPAAGVPPVTQGHYKVGRPYQIKGEWYTPEEDWDYRARGIASWYGHPFHGRLTANGETFNKEALTAAHKTLPLPSLVRVTNLSNNKTIVVRVNDRGPFADDRIIDLSERAARDLGFHRQGLADVEVEILSRAPLTIARHDEGVAEAKTRLAAASPAPARETARAPQANPRLTMAPIADPAPARTADSDPADPAAEAIMAAMRANPARTAPPLVEERGPRGGPAAPMARIVTSRVETVNPALAAAYGGTAQPYFVQAGAFTDANNALRLKGDLQSLGTAAGPVSVSSFSRDGLRFYRVRIGPLPSALDADQALRQVMALGHTDATIIAD